MCKCAPMYVRCTYDCKFTLSGDSVQLLQHQVYRIKGLEYVSMILYVGRWHQIGQFVEHNGTPYPSPIQPQVGRVTHHTMQGAPIVNII